MITDLTVEQNRGAGIGAFDLANLAGYGVGIMPGSLFSKIFSSNLGDSYLVVSAIIGASSIFVYFVLREPGHASNGRRSLRVMYDSLTFDVVGILLISFSLTIILGFCLFLP